MIINDFNLICIALPLNKTVSVLIIDTYTIRQVVDVKVSAKGWPKMELI